MKRQKLTDAEWVDMIQSSKYWSLLEHYLCQRYYIAEGVPENQLEWITARAILGRQSGDTVRAMMCRALGNTHTDSIRVAAETYQVVQELKK